MRSLLIVPSLIAVLLFTGCEATVVERRPVVEHRYGYSDGGYYRGRSDYRRDDSYYRTRPQYRDGYYDSSRSVRYTSGYERTRSPYRSDVNYSRNTTVQRTNVNRINVNRTNVVRTGSPNAYRTTAVSNQRHHVKNVRRIRTKTAISRRYGVQLICNRR